MARARFSIVSRTTVIAFRRAARSVKVTGKVGEFAVLGGRSIGLHLRARDLDYSDR